LEAIKAGFRDSHHIRRMPKKRQDCVLGFWQLSAIVASTADGTCLARKSL
jgi:hypothetical protein